jgi:N-methylhydantoinase A
MSYVINVDIGGTHTDGVAIDKSGTIVSGKVQSTPDDFSEGFFDSLSLLAEKLDMTTSKLVGEAELVSHGTTVGTNAIIENEGAETALVTTKGMESTLSIMRGAKGRTSGLPVEEYLRMQEVTKPDPLVERDARFGVHERIDCMGDVIVEFNESQARRIAADLDNKDVDSVAVSFLWSFLNDDHESQMKKILLEELDSDTFVTTSNRLSPTWGEYERMAATAINALIGPTTSEYIERISNRLTDLGYDGTLLVMKVEGGVTPAEDAVDEPVRTIDSGPAAGLTGSGYLANLLGHENVIAADMGGTSFDVGLLTDGTPITKATNNINQYDYSIRNIDIESVGSGGGSIAWVEAGTNRLRVGPESAGADPGPACYDQGGDEFTITDADLLCGFLDPDHFLGGRASLDDSLAEEAAKDIAEELGMGPIDLARGVIEIANTQMADLISQRTINKGHDPRNFKLYAYGGAGPLHLPAIAHKLEVDEVVIPIGESSSVWSAVGISSSDVLYRAEASNIRTFAPFDPETLTDRFEKLEKRVQDRLNGAGFDTDEINLERYANLSYGMQVHEVTVPMPDNDLDADDLEDMIARYEHKYEDLYGEGAGASETGFELVTLRVDGYGPTANPNLEAGQSETPASQCGSTEEIFWPIADRRIETEIYYSEHVHPDSSIQGPAVIRLENTTAAVPPGDTADIDQYNNIIVRNE